MGRQVERSANGGAGNPRAIRKLLGRLLILLVRRNPEMGGRACCAVQAEQREYEQWQECGGSSWARALAGA